MIKKFSLFVGLYLIGFTVFSQDVRYKSKIDRIQTIAEVDSFLKDDLRSPYEMRLKPREAKDSFHLKLKSIYDYFYDSLGIQRFLKADFDNDGRTDLLINAIWRLRPSGFIVLDKGNDQYDLHPFIDHSGNNMNMSFIKPDTFHNIAGIKYYLVDMEKLTDSIYFRILKDEFKTGFLLQKYLVFKFGHFIEENKHPTPLKFKWIRFQRWVFLVTISITVSRYSRIEKSI